MSEDLFSRDEVLAGLPARRARTLLFLIESRTGRLVAKSRQAMERFLTDQAAQERDLAFLEAFALGEDPPLRPSIQDLEHHAAHWADLVPLNPRLRAAVAHFLGEKYDFAYASVPAIRQALSLDDEAVQRAYQRLYREPLETIYTPRPPFADRLRWRWKALAGWLESLPPFWTAFALTLTETVGASILALPIALASVGPLAGVVLLIVLGLVNVLTIAYMAEALTRSARMRYGGAFVGRMVEDYLGRAGSLILSLALLAICLLALLAFYSGLSTTLADATPVPAEIWVAALFLIGLYFVRRESLDATIASALVVGAINIGLIFILSLLALTHLRVENMLFVNADLFDPSILQLVFGVVLAAYFGHLSVSNCAKVVMRRDPTGRSLIWGVVAAQATAMVLYVIWVMAVNGAIAPAALASESSTALIPLAAEVGSIVHVFGSIFVVLGMGMASIHFSLGAFNLVRERLPTQSQGVVVLPRRRGTLVFRESDAGDRGARIGLVYVGLDGNRPQFRLDVQWAGDTHHLEAAASEKWDAGALLAQFPDLRRRGIRLTLEIQEASPDAVRLRVASSLAFHYAGEWDTVGLGMADLLALPDAQRDLMTWLMRRSEVSLADAASHTGHPEKDVARLLDTLAEQGFVREVETAGETRYRARLAPKRGSRLPADIWSAIDDSLEEDSRSEAGQPGAGTAVQRLRDTLLGNRGRLLISLSPVVFVFLLTEWLLVTGTESFSEPLALIGVITVPILGGIFPALLLVASRRKGELVPDVVYRFLGHPVLIAGVYLLFLASLFLHGLIIWDDPVQRGIALAVGLLMVGLTIALSRQRAFAPRLVIQLRADERERGETVFAVTDAGHPGSVDAELIYAEGEKHVHGATGQVPDFSGLKRAVFQIKAPSVEDLKVWAYKLTLADELEGLPATLEMHRGGQTERFDLELTQGQVVRPIEGETCRLELTFPESAAE